MTALEPVYQERQQFRQVWIWAVMLACDILVGAALLQAAQGTPFPGQLALLLPLVLLAAINLLIYATRLDVRLEGEVLRVHFWPFPSKGIALSDIANCGARVYRPVYEYGGWGVRYSLFGHGWAYNVSGNQGVQLELKNGRKILIGSQHAQELADAINHARGV